MNYLDVLRQLADQQQFALLVDNADNCWRESADPASLALLALACAHLGDRTSAEDALAQLEPWVQVLDLDARVDLAAAYILTGRMREAEALLSAALGKQPRHALALARLAFCYMQTGQWSDARRLYRKATEGAPHRLPVWTALARLDAQANDLASAQAVLDAAQAQLVAQREVLPAAVTQTFTAQLNGLQLEIWLQGDGTAQAEAWLENQRTLLPEDDWVAYISNSASVLAGCDRHPQADATLREALKAYPENFVLLGQFAELAQAQGRTLQALQVLRRALALAKRKGEPAPRLIGLWTRISEASLRGFDQQARKAAEEALALAQGLVASNELPEPRLRMLRWQAESAMAQVESEAQRFEEAEALYNAILAENPWFLPALQGLGHQQMLRGRIDEAVALFERVQEMNPARGAMSLISARQIPDDPQLLERIERLAHRPSLEGSTRSGLLFQLAAAWEKKKDFERAFALATEANRASRVHLKYAPQDHRQRCARIRHAFSKALFDHRAECGKRGEDESLPIFVLGMPRSGTTLVEQIIAGHSLIFGAGELGIIPSRIQGLNRWERHVGSGRSYPDCVDDLDPHVTRGIAEGLIKELKELATVSKPQALYIVDKLPHNFENIGLIKFLFPEAKIISVRRDPRDIAMSNYFTDYAAKHAGMGFAYDLTWIGEQLADHNLLMHHWNQIFPGEILEINYEDVVEDTEAMARKMLDYIGVAWEPQVLDFSNLDRPVKTASVWQVRQPIYKSSKAKWRHYRQHLAPLIVGTNARITWEPIAMETLPAPGLLNDGVALYEAEKLNEAEYEFKKLLHHFPEHAAANYMVGLIYVRKGHLQEGIALMAQALEKCPWKRPWRHDLIQAYEMAGETDKAQALKRKRFKAEPPDETDDVTSNVVPFDVPYSEEVTRPV